MKSIASYTKQVLLHTDVFLSDFVNGYWLYSIALYLIYTIVKETHRCQKSEKFISIWFLKYMYITVWKNVIFHSQLNEFYTFIAHNHPKLFYKIIL